MVDYVKLQKTAIRLIKKNGREITLIGLNETAADPSKPWNGPAAGGETDLIVSGVFVPPNTVRQFGLTALGEGTEFRDLITLSEQVIIIAQGDIDIRTFTDVLDRGERWGIIGMQVLRPGPITLLSFIGVRR